MVNLGGRQMKVNAFLDGGSDTSYIREEVVRELGAIQHEENIQIPTLVGAVVNKPASEVVINIVGANNGKLIATIQTWTLPVVCEDLEMMNWDADKHKWIHLRDTDFQKPAESDVVDLLIGSDYPELHEVLERRSGPPQTPVAMRTPLGWVCVAPVGAASVTPPPTGRPRVGTRASAAVGKIELTRRFWEVHELATKEPERLSDQEEVAEEKASKPLYRANSHYKLGMPRKDDWFFLADNPVSKTGHQRRRRQRNAEGRRTPDDACRNRGHAACPVADFRRLRQQRLQPVDAASLHQGSAKRPARAGAARQRRQAPQTSLTARAKGCEPNLAPLSPGDAAQPEPPAASGRVSSRTSDKATSF